MYGRPVLLLLLARQYLRALPRAFPHPSPSSCERCPAYEAIPQGPGRPPGTPGVVLVLHAQERFLVSRGVTSRGVARKGLRRCNYKLSWHLTSDLWGATDGRRRAGRRCLDADSSKEIDVFHSTRVRVKVADRISSPASNLPRKTWRLLLPMLVSLRNTLPVPSPVHLSWPSASDSFPILLSSNRFARAGSAVFLGLDAWRQI